MKNRILHGVERISPLLYLILKGLFGKKRDLNFFFVKKIIEKYPFIVDLKIFDIKLQSLNYNPKNEFYYKKLLIEKEDLCDVVIPNTFGIVKSSKMTFYMPERSFYHFKDVVIYSGSDFIIKDNSAYWEKANFSNFNNNLVQDSNIIHLDKSTDSFTTLEPTNSISLKHVINLAGVHVNHWSHFIVERLETLIRLKSIINDFDLTDQISVIIPKHIDNHISQMLNKYFKGSSDFVFIDVDINVKILCKNLYHLDRGAMIKDHGEFGELNDLLVRNSVRNWLKTIYDKKYILNISNKIFISRNGIRNLENYEEVKSYFLNLGFIECFPHLLSLDEKIKLFTNATHIVGPLSSGFTNLIFSNENVKILALINKSRMTDTFITSIISEPENLIYIAGREINPGNPHSNYFISIEEIQECVRVNNFC